MKRLKIPGIIDTFNVTDPNEIKALARNPRLDRKFEGTGCPVNRLLLKRSLMVLSLNGRRFPTMMPRDSAQNATDRRKLWETLTSKAAATKTGPEELEPLAAWVRGESPETQPGILIQQLLGRLFSNHFQATPQSWAAAQTLVAAPRSNNLPRMLWWFLTGKVRRAKRLLAEMLHQDLSAVNAIGIAAHNVVKSIRHMQLLYADAAARTALSPEAAAGQCLFAPVSLYRQATADGELNGCLFSRDSLFVLNIGEAGQQPEGRSLVFMDDTWSQCPANLWVPAMLQGVWTRAITQPPSA